MSKLNPLQQQAVEQIDGPLLILAGAGSGKTRTVTHRIAHMIDLGIKPDEIMAVTFTNKAANEMKERLEKLLEDRPKVGGPLFAHAPYMVRGMWVGTFHSICGKILRKDIESIPNTRYRTNFNIFDDTDQLAVIKAGINKLGLDDKQYTPRSVLSRISHAKSNAMDVDAMHAASKGYQQQNVARVYEYYQQELGRQNGLDFDDMLLLTVRLFETAPEVLARYQQRFKYFMVDEYQDTNKTQYRLIQLLAQQSRNLCVVGDVDQSIYSFRAADFRIILDFKQEFPDATVIKLEENYRSTGTILEAANHLIQHNTDRFEKNLWTQKPKGDRITLYPAMDEREEAEYVAMQIRKRRGDRPLADFAVLYRTNSQSRALEEAFLRYGTPYRLVGGVRFYERKEIKDVVSYLRLISNPSDEASFTRIVNVPKRGLGKTSIDRVVEAAKAANAGAVELIAGGLQIEGLSPKNMEKLRTFSGWILGLHAYTDRMELPNLVKQVVEDSGYLQALKDENTEEANGRIENVEQFVNVAYDFQANSDDKSLAAFLTHMMLLGDLDQLTTEEGVSQDRVTLMTLHSAKGLEFPIVFLTGLEEGVFPHSRSLDDPAQLEEERRLAYVGITRAMDQLAITHASRRMMYGEYKPSIPSRFLRELPPELVDAVESPLAKMQARVTPGGPINKRNAADVVWMQDWSQGDEGARRPAPVAPKGPRVKIDTLEVGDRVRHEKFGEGVVARIIGTGEKATLAVSFPGLGQKILDPRIAPLERLDF
ncbi:MAG: ATP-dependent helicase PcrA [Cyanobacteria bacterium RYN_339]|nr:ATP-dependent helicase PcrA [Cyanobacteria bacterium RYN_339]